MRENESECVLCVGFLFGWPVKSQWETHADENEVMRNYVTAKVRWCNRVEKEFEEYAGKWKGTEGQGGGNRDEMKINGSSQQESWWAIHRNGMSQGRMCRQRARGGLTAEEAETVRGADWRLSERKKESRKWGRVDERPTCWHRLRSGLQPSPGAWKQINCGSGSVHTPINFTPWHWEGLSSEVVSGWSLTSLGHSNNRSRAGC